LEVRIFSGAQRSGLRGKIPTEDLLPEPAVVDTTASIEGAADPDSN
jgi:hypothetical protein